MTNSQGSWVVVLGTERDPADWGLSQKARACWTHQGTPAEHVATARLIVINKMEALECTDMQTFLLDISPESRVWVHFGERNTDTLTRLQIDSLWGDVCKTAHFKPLGCLPTNPFSMGSINPFTWDRSLRSLASVIRSTHGTDQGFDVALWVNRLSDAWDEAQTYYHVAKPLSEWLARVFPLYLGIRSAWSIENPEASAERWKAAKDIWNLHAPQNALWLLSGTQGLVARAITVLSADALDQTLDDAERAGRFLSELNGDTALPSVEDAERLLALSELSKLMEQAFLA